MRILTFDTESSTGCVNDGSLCSFGYYLFDTETGNALQEDILIKPMAKFRKGIIGKNGKIGLAYDESVFYASPKFSFQYEKIKNIISTSDVVIGFAIENDVKYLRDACDKYRLPQIEYNFIDVKQLLELFTDELKDKGLSSIAEVLGFDFIAHRSDEDARVTYFILEYLLKKHNKSLEELLSFAEIVQGKNFQKGFSHMYSLAQLYGRNGFKRTSRQSSDLFDYIQNNIGQRAKGGPLHKKSIAISREIRYDDIAKTYGIIKKIYALGGKYANCTAVGNTFIYRESACDIDKDFIKAKEAVATGRRIIFIEEQEFLNILGKIEPQTFDFLAVIKSRDEQRFLAKLENNNTKQQSRGTR